MAGHEGVSQGTADVLGKDSVQASRDRIPWLSVLIEASGIAEMASELGVIFHGSNKMPKSGT